MTATPITATTVNAEGGEVEAHEAAGLVLLVGDVQGLEQRLHPRGGAIECQQQRQGRTPAELGGAGRGHGVRLDVEQVDRLLGHHRAQRADLLLDDRRIGHQAVDRHQRGDRREQRQQGVERAAGGNDRHIVLADLAPDPLQHLEPAAGRNRRRAVRTPARRLSLVMAARRRRLLLAWRRGALPAPASVGDEHSDGGVQQELGRGRDGTGGLRLPLRAVVRTLHDDFLFWICNTNLSNRQIRHWLRGHAVVARCRRRLELARPVPVRVRR